MEDKSDVILFSLVVIGIVTVAITGIVTSHIETEHFITEGYQQCYVTGYGTEWMKECNSQVVVEKRQ